MMHIQLMWDGHRCCRERLWLRQEEAILASSNVDERIVDERIAAMPK